MSGNNNVPSLPEETRVLVEGLWPGEAMGIDGHLVLVLFDEGNSEIPTWMDSTRFEVRKYRRDGILSNEYYGEQVSA